MSARALSLQAGLSPAYVFKLEAGQVEPSLRCFGRLALVLGMTHEEIWVCMAIEASHGPSIAPAPMATHGSSGGN
jgi:predicted transcriptional regulator